MSRKGEVSAPQRNKRPGRQNKTVSASGKLFSKMNCVIIHTTFERCRLLFMPDKLTDTD